MHGRVAVDRGDERLERRDAPASASDSSGTTCSRTSNGDSAPAVGVDRGEAGGEHPVRRLVDRAAQLPAEAPRRGREQRERPPGPRRRTRLDFGGLEPAYEQHGSVQ